METVTDENLKFEADWLEYRKRRNHHYLACGSIVLFVIFVRILTYFSTTIFKDCFTCENVMASIYLLVIASYLVLNLVTMARFNTWKCPKCKEQFFAFSFWVSSPVMMDNCHNCKLPKYYSSSFYKGMTNFFDWEQYKK
jgi:hypothetical protein